MTATQQGTERPPVRARSGRRPIPPLVFLLVLALAALGVWWNVLKQDAEQQATRAAACTTAAAAPSLDPATVAVRVLNATDEAGRAQQVAAALEGRGFTISEIGNDPSDRAVTGAGEVRFGPRGTDAARFVALQQPGVELYQDTRATSTVDLVIGPTWAALAEPEAIAATLAAAAQQKTAC
jgi:hypothetical protein